MANLKIFSVIILFLIPTILCFVIPEDGKHKTDNENDSELMLVQLLFRHGDRTPISLYDTDQYRNYNFKEGLGQLTKYGKKRLYGYGKYLRQRYSKYLENILLKNVDANSSPLRRCIETNQLVLAGMLPPEGPWSDNDTLSHEWVPIAVETSEMSRAWLLSPEAKCPKAELIEKNMGEEPKLKEFLKENKEIIQNVFKATFGSNVTNWQQLAWIDDTLEVEKQYFGENFKQPDWLTHVGTKSAVETMSLLRKANDFQFYSPGQSKEYLKLRTGLLLNRLINNMKSIGSNVPKSAEDRKLFTFSSHDTMIAYVMHSLGFFRGQPGYGSGLIFELRKHSTPEPFVHLYYANVTNNNEIIPLALNESKTFQSFCTSRSCPLSGFAKGLESYIIENNDAVQEACKL